MINRKLKSIIEKKLGTGKAIFVIGPRQTGKTTLLKKIAEENLPFLFLDGDDPSTRELLNTPNTEQIKSIIGNYKLVFIDEVQRIQNIGLTLKIVIDQFKDVQLFASGSSSLDIAHSVNEPLTGRKWEYHLYPISWMEFEDHIGFLKSFQALENRLLYGMYPEVLNHPGEEKERLMQLVNSYLYKDILSYSNIKKSDVLERLLQALAFQIGNEVSYNELSSLLNIDKNTVSNYIDLLEKCFVVFRLTSFSRNLRNEIKHNRKVYFYDNGIRNMLIGNFSSLNLRTDKGALWENFLISERKKVIEYNQLYCKSYFWRTTQQQEIDYVEESDGEIKAYEFKWSPAAKVKTPKIFTDTYLSEPVIISTDNFRDFLK